MHRSPIQHCRECGAAVTYRLPDDGDTKSRAICTVCHTVHYENPLNVVGTVPVWGETGEYVLLCLRNIEPRRGKWTLPAGFVNGGEDPAAAAARECFEETGLIVRVTRVLELIPGREHERGADFVIVYLAEVTGGELAAADDADAAEWFERDALPPLAFRATKQALAG